MLVNNRNYRTVWMENSSVFMIDQLKLPFRFEIFESKGYKTTSKAIKDMVIRGAPAIGAAACYAYAQSVINFKGREIEHLQKEMEGAEKLIKSARPTANDLFYAVNFLKEKLVECKNVDDAKKDALKFSNEYADLSSEQCRKIGIHGNGLIKQNQKILTHCNAGALACVDYGTALSPIRAAHHGGKNIFVYADETRPRSQGARLTAFELCSEKIPHALIADNAAGYFMKEGKIDLVIVGADRIAMNGDFANKIGTYEKAVVAKENSIPFYVAAPLSTFDKSAKSGKDIPVEFRSEEEVLYIDGIDENNEIRKIRIAPPETNAENPAFDVTPAKYVTGFITEKGIIKPSIEEIAKFAKEKNSFG